MCIVSEVNRVLVEAIHEEDPEAYLEAAHVELSIQIQRLKVAIVGHRNAKRGVWSFTDYTNEDGAFACDVCGEDAVRSYNRDSTKGLETYCDGCVLERYPHLNLDIIPTVLPD